MTVWADLDGHEFDLATLARLFPTGDPRVVVEDGRTYLEATALGDLDSATGGHLVATTSDLLARMNGIATLHDSGFQPVRPRNRFVDSDGVHHLVGGDVGRGREHVAVVAGVARARLGALAAGAVVDGVAVTHEPFGPRQLARAAAHQDADDLFALIGRAGALGWDPLWKAMEIIKEAVGGKAALIATGWITDDDHKVFGYSANHPDASGTEARHARRPPTTPPSRVMSIEEGQQFIRDLARRWLDSLPLTG